MSGLRRNSEPGDGVFPIGMLAGLDHHYPTRRRNATGFNWLPRFRRCFEDRP